MLLFLLLLLLLSFKEAQSRGCEAGRPHVPREEEGWQGGELRARSWVVFEGIFIGFSMIFSRFARFFRVLNGF